MFIFWETQYQKISNLSKSIHGFYTIPIKKKIQQSFFGGVGWVEIHNLILKSAWKCKIVLKKEKKAEGPKLPGFKT